MVSHPHHICKNKIAPWSYLFFPIIEFGKVNMEVLHQCTMKETDHILIVHNHETAEQGDLRVKYSM